MLLNNIARGKPGNQTGNQGSSPCWLVVDTFVKIHFLPQTNEKKTTYIELALDDQCRSVNLSVQMEPHLVPFCTLRVMRLLSLKSAGTNGILICHVTVTQSILGRLKEQCVEGALW